MTPQAPSPASIVLADVPERARLRELQAALDQLRDEIASLELELQGLRDELVAFETGYQSRMADENAALSRIRALVRHLERWEELLHASIPREELTQKVRRVERKREREAQKLREEAARRQAQREQEEQEDDASKRQPPGEELKSLYRKLARRYHPDLAVTEDERVKNGAIMARINELYRSGDLDGLHTLAEQMKGGELDMPDAELSEQIVRLEERLAWFEAVMENLKDERVALERSSTCALWRSVQQAEEAGEDLFVKLKAEMRERVRKAYDDIPAAVRALEVEVSRHNRSRSTGLVPQPSGRKDTALEKIFDPYADKRMVRLGLQDLAALQVGAEARKQAQWLEELAASRPQLSRLVLLTYACELSPFPLPGLEKYEDLSLRFSHLIAAHEQPLRFEEALVELADVLEFGVRRMTEKVVHLGLRFRSDALREGAAGPPGAGVRAELRKVLGVLGERSRCTRCAREVFAVPLFKLRGLDDLRAVVCPHCGDMLKSYWMPTGKDVQAVLNDAFLDLEMISEWSLRMARTSVALQLTPRQVDAMNVGGLKQRFHKDVIERHELKVTLDQVELCQDRERVPDRAPLADLDETTFTVQFSADTGLSVADALEMIRHRIRNRFKPDPKL